MNELRDNLKRVNIILTKEEHPRFKKHAEKHYHNSLSQFARASMEIEIERHQNGGGIVDIDVILRPLVERLEEVEKAVNQIANGVEKTERGVDLLVGRFGSRIEKVADDVEKLLEERGEALSVPEIGDFLPYSQDEIIRALEKLEDEFAVVRVESEKRPTRWRIRGGAHGCKHRK